MIDYPGLLLVGGASRNLGKTELVCRILKKFESKQPLVGLKIKTLRSGEEKYHGKDPFIREAGGQIRIVEESNRESDEDTGRMLRAGASRVFRIRCQEDALGDAFQRWLDLFPGEKPTVICESNSLRRVLLPGLFIMLAPWSEDVEWKPSALPWKGIARPIVYSNGKDRYDPDPIPAIHLKDGGWIYGAE